MADIAQTLSPAERIRKRPDFERVYNQGLKTPGRFMTLFLLRNGSSVSRLGIAATRKLGGAVQRNRAKRLAREISGGTSRRPVSTWWSFPVGNS